jgi:hypothetical protein
MSDESATMQNAAYVVVLIDHSSRRVHAIVVPLIRHVETSLLPSVDIVERIHDRTVGWCCVVTA